LACTTADGTAAKVKAGISTRAPGAGRARAERQEDRRRAGGDRERVFRAHEVGELPLKKGHGGILGRGIAEQIAGTQEAVDLCSGGLGDGFGVIDVGCNAVIGRHGFTFLKCPISRILTCTAD
jgi:hypothetical protein